MENIDDIDNVASSSLNNQAIKKKENPNACIFVASLNKEIEDEDLNSSVSHLFENWGPLLSVKVFKDWLKRPYAFVQYEFVEDCKRALLEAPGNKLNGRHIRCEPARVNRSICLISLNYPFNKKYIHSQLSVFGEVEDITNLQPHGKFHSVFIKFKYREDAIKAYLTLKFSDNQDKSIPLKTFNHQWFIEWAANLDADSPYGICGSSCRLDKTSIFIGNLNENVEEKDLTDVFDKHGQIINVQIIRKPFQHHAAKKVFAFIKFSHEKYASDAIEQNNGILFQGKTIRVCHRQIQNYKQSCSYFEHASISLMQAPYTGDQVPDQRPPPPQQNSEEYPSAPPFICFPPCYNSIPPMYEPYATAGKLNYQNHMDIVPYHPYTDNQSASSSPGHSPTSPSGASVPANMAVPVAVTPNGNYVNGYYLNSYPTMIYYNYSPYYQVNANVTKNS